MTRKGPPLHVILGGLAIDKAAEDEDALLDRCAKVAESLRTLEDDDIAQLLEEHLLPDMKVGDVKTEILCEAIVRLVSK